MGYSHYWDIGINSKGWKDALQATQKIIKNSPVPLADWDGLGEIDSELVSGVYLNGVDPDGCETFYIPLSPDGSGFHCCKTRGRKYDAVVTAILCAFNHFCPEFDPRSDGGIQDWELGRQLASNAIGCEVEMPSQIHIRDSYR
tara:strand:+ start:5993 stop:6421 length:429 start_codon:yes stop_codon:yes gene_type:complete